MGLWAPLANNLVQDEWGILLGRIQPEGIPLKMRLRHILRLEDGCKMGMKV